MKTLATEKCHSYQICPFSGHICILSYATDLSDMHIVDL